MLTVYVIQNEKGKIYIGYTSNLVKRLDRHNKVLPSKNTSFTSKNSGNWVVRYTETFATRQEAIRREKELKSYQGRLFIKNLLNT